LSESDRAALCSDAETFSCNTGDVLSNQFVFHFKQLNVLHTAFYKSKYFYRKVPVLS